MHYQAALKIPDDVEKRFRFVHNAPSFLHGLRKILDTARLELDIACHMV